MFSSNGFLIVVIDWEEKNASAAVIEGLSVVTTQCSSDHWSQVAVAAWQVAYDSEKVTTRDGGKPNQGKDTKGC